MDVIILGAGPTGLGAAWRLYELGDARWSIFEKSHQVGGLSASFLDDCGYTWDVGGHVLFSHYDYFDRVLDRVMAGSDSWIHHERESWIRIEDRWVPYPFQMNIRHLAPESFLKCVRGLMDVYSHPLTSLPRNFSEWIDASFGRGLAEIFLRPYNWKVWGYPPETMSCQWVGERVATIDVHRVIENYVYQRDDVSWGPNHRFRFPAFGGTGAIWKAVSASLPGDRLVLGEACTAIDLDAHLAQFASGLTRKFDRLISTMALPQLCRIANILPRFPKVDELGLSSTHVVGIGVRGTVPEELRTKCWMYFPEDGHPFYRVTHFSHYSPNNVPDISGGWSLMAEVSETAFKPVSQSQVVDDVIRGLVNSGLLENRSQVEQIWYRVFRETYPVPTLDREAIVAPILEFLERHDVFSRGRMGAWKYEVGNMDHSFMQGKECVDRILYQAEEQTLNYPHIVNAPKNVNKQ
jgi:protoporphyrinogen oxidase